MKPLTITEAREFIALNSGFVKADAVGWNYPPNGSYFFNAPNYFSDTDREVLFWMHQAEKTLTREQASFYHDLLGQNITPHVDCKASGKWAERWTFHADASTRARAFLAVHGYKLKETK